MALIVNGEMVGEDVLEGEFGRIKGVAEAANPGVSCCERDPEFRAEAERNVVGRVLLTGYAAERVVEVGGDEVDEAIGGVAEAMGGWDRFHAAYGKGAEKDDGLRAEVAMNVRVNRVIDEELGEGCEVGEEELRGFYEGNQELFMTAERVRASHILRRAAEGAGREEAFGFMRGVRREVLSGADFDAVARERSDRVKEVEEERAERGDGDAGGEGEGGGAGDGVDLGWFAMGELMEEFSRVAFSMEVGEVSPVFVSGFGFHVVKLTGREEPILRGFEEVREEAREMVLGERRAAAAERLVERLRGEAVVERVEGK